MSASASQDTYIMVNSQKKTAWTLLETQKHAATIEWRYADVWTGRYRTGNMMLDRAHNLRERKGRTVMAHERSRSNDWEICDGKDGC